MEFLSLVCFLFLSGALGEISQLGDPLYQVTDKNNDETERIVGGQPAKEGRFPYVVALYNDADFICTASIISERTILTAAHCVVYDGVLQHESAFNAVVGSANRSSSDGTRIHFRKITPHPEYDGRINDIALLETTDSIKFNKKVQPICIASADQGKLVFKKVVAMGWGGTTNDEKNSTTPDVLRYVDQKVTSNLLCSILFRGNAVPSSILCANGLWSGVCYGDSGGPLVLSRARPVQVGVASYVNGRTGCGKYLGPAGFTRVSSFVDFIMSKALGKVCIG